MTKTIRLSLSLMLVMASSSLAQQSSLLAPGVYEQWKKEKLAAMPGGLDTPHYALAAVTPRLNAGTAKIEFFVVGKMTEVEFQIQPKHTEKLPSGEFQEVNAGTPLTSRLTAGDGQRRGGGGLTVIIPVNESANAFEVKWTIKGGDLKQVNNTGWLDLKDIPSSGIMAVMY